MKRAKIPILLYHSVSSDPPDWIAPFTVTPEQFRTHLDLIVASGRQALTLSDFVECLANPRADGRDKVVITFDDGFADFVTVAGPALADRGLPSTIYASTGSLSTAGGGVPPGWTPHSVLPGAQMMEWKQLGELDGLGAELGAHSHSHPHLDTISSMAARDEIVISRDLLEQATGGAIRSFAYPHGYSSRRVRSLVADAGFGSAAGVRNRFSSPSDDRFNIARLTVRSTTTDETIRSWLAGQSAQVASPLEEPRAAVWRVARMVSRSKLLDRRASVDR